ncbi:uncharacterized protein LOC123326034 [Neomonachus schauinslandi]|uniref:Uncharacterized protein LOC123326034 n=1 Tax=Neomonachus schauinslandi TaxID=29088 RepID=A0A8M1MQK2_NEOSC|nr:uncharacterized protein LOC123326034 [Neomonachus schauinslandi]
MPQLWVKAKPSRSSLAGPGKQPRVYIVLELHNPSQEGVRVAGRWPQSQGGQHRTRLERGSAGSRKRTQHKGTLPAAGNTTQPARYLGSRQTQLRRAARAAVGPRVRGHLEDGRQHLRTLGGGGGGPGRPAPPRATPPACCPKRGGGGRWGAVGAQPKAGALDANLESGPAHRGAGVCGRAGPATPPLLPHGQPWRTSHSRRGHGQAGGLTARAADWRPWSETGAAQSGAFPQYVQETASFRVPSSRPARGPPSPPTRPPAPSEFRLKTTLPVAAADLGSEPADNTAGGCRDDPECSLNQFKVLLLGICDVGNGNFKGYFLHTPFLTIFIISHRV